MPRRQEATVPMQMQKVQALHQLDRVTLMRLTRQREEVIKPMAKAELRLQET
ncbi:hypothetical protein ANCCAN_04027 [Ancylostoma caninum]|uniref:Uncharacterized protein n=1 Tax=Ancylostoma caninum TaxID=29170 RepID=A0A368H3C8_ANCCA|nr:hypothetical protein ANCCAN_04027 [Ancylostoma caninum]